MDEFKALFCKALKTFRAFIDSYWTKIRQDSQYQLEKVLDWPAYLKHLQAVLKKFDPFAITNKEILICYLWEGLHSSIWAQLDNQGRNLDGWDKVVEKAVSVEAKANLQPPSGTREIDSKYLKGYKPSIKKDKDNTYWEHHNEAFNQDKDKAKSHNSFSANQP